MTTVVGMTADKSLSKSVSQRINWGNTTAFRMRKLQV